MYKKLTFWKINHRKIRVSLGDICEGPTDDQTACFSQNVTFKHTKEAGGLASTSRKRVVILASESRKRAGRLASESRKMGR